MTNEEINKAIAEACGWTLKPTAIEKPSLVLERKYVLENRWHSPDGEVWKSTKDYCNGLNAMHEAEEKLIYSGDSWSQTKQSKIYTFESWLLRLSAHPVHATALQRAEALLRTLDLWKD